MRPPLRIAILECDSPPPNANAKYGGYGGVFTILLEAGAQSLAQETGSKPIELKLSAYDVVNKKVYPDLNDIDAVLLSGSKFNSFDDDPWILDLVAWTEKVLQQKRVRIIGVCFGHQIVGRAMGAGVGRSDRGWEVSVVPMTLTPKGKEIFGWKEPDMFLHQMHRDVVFNYPEGVEELAYSPRCDVQGFYQKGRVISVQGHPEFNEEIVTELLNKRHNDGIFDDDMYNDGMARVVKKHDGVEVAKGFLKFCLEE